MRWVLTAAIAVLAAFLAASVGFAQGPPKRVALIIANADYAGQTPLINPPTDANLVRNALTVAGFSVEVQSNLTKVQTDAALLAFRRRAEGADVALLYFAGHGVRVGQNNYLLPTDFNPVDVTREADFDLFAPSHAQILRALAGAKARVAIFDACRDNPFEARLRLASRSATRSVGGLQGLAPIEVDDVMVMFSAGAGQFAADGAPGQGSPFARAFAQRIVEPNQDVRVIASKVRADVVQAGGDRPDAQRPFIVGSPADGPVVLVSAGHGAPPQTVTPVAPPAVLRSAASRAWAEDARPRVLASWSPPVDPVAGISNDVNYAYDVALSPDGRQIAAAFVDRRVRVWAADGGQLIRTLPTGSTPMSALDFHRGRLIAVGEDGQVHAWSAATGQQQFQFAPDNGDLYDFAAPTRGDWLVLVGDRGVRIVETPSGEILRELEGHAGSVLTAALSPDDTRLATGGLDNVVRIWDPARGRLLMTLEGHETRIVDIAYSPDGRIIASGGFDGDIRLWDAASGAPIRVLAGHRTARGATYVSSLAFSPDGSLLASGGRDDLVRVWDVASGDQVATLRGHTEGVTGVRFSADGTRIASSSEDGSVRVWAAR